MANFKEMYFKLFRSQTSAIRILQEAQQATEEMYIESGEAEIVPFAVLKKETEPENPDKKE